MFFLFFYLLYVSLLVCLFWLAVQNLKFSHLCSVSVPLCSGISRVDGHCRPDPLCFESSAHHSSHPGCVRLFSTSLQRPDCHLHLLADPRAVEPGCRAAGGLLHCHCSWLYFTLCCWLLWQWGHCHLRPAVHLLSLGMYRGISSVRTSTVQWENSFSISTVYFLCWSLCSLVFSVIDYCIWFTLVFEVGL